MQRDFLVIYIEAERSQKVNNNIAIITRGGIWTRKNQQWTLDTVM